MAFWAEHNLEATFDDAVMGFNGVIRIYAILDGFRLAISIGLLPAVSYANAAHRIRRVFSLIGHACWINGVFGTISAIVTAFFAKYLAMMISNSENYLRWAIPMLKAANWESPIGWMRNVIQTVLQALQYGTTATLYSFGATFLVYIATVSVLYAMKKTDFVKLLLTMPIHVAISVAISLVIVYFPLKKLWDIKDQFPIEEDGSPGNEEDGTEFEDLEKGDEG
jgi:Na+-driven multidrug efflux pump